MTNQYNTQVNTNQVPRHQCQVDYIAAPIHGQTAGTPSAQNQPDGYATADHLRNEHSTWESEGGAVSPESELKITDVLKRDNSTAKECLNRAFESYKQYDTTTDTSDLKEPEVCDECGGALNLVELIRQQIQERRQFLFDELDVLDQDERDLDDPMVQGVLTQYGEYIQ